MVTDNTKIKVEIMRPFGPSLARVKMPQELIDDFNKTADEIIADKDEVKRRDYSDNLVGKVKQEFSLPQDTFKEHQGFFDTTIETYLSWNDQFNNITRPKDCNYNISYKSGWYVRTFAGDFNPSHMHTGCHMSSVGYLKLPDKIEEEWEEDYKDNYPCVGHIEFQHGTPALWNPHSQMIKPEIGDFYIFPAYLLHTVYPFKSKGERRSFSFNTSVKLVRDGKEIPMNAR